MWTWVSRIILTYKKGLLLVVGLLTIVMVWFAMHLELSHDFAKVIPVSDPEYQEYLKFKSEFGEDGNVLIIGIESDKLFTTPVFKGLYVLTEDLKSFPGVENVVSLTHLFLLKKDSLAEKFNFSAISPLPPLNDREADSLRQIIINQPIYKNLFINEKQNVSLIAVSLNKDQLDSKEKITMVNNITARVNRFGEKFNIKLHYSGLPYIRAYTSEKIPKELTLFLVLSVIVTTLSLFLFFKTFSSVIFPLILLFLSIIWSMGLIALFGYKMTLMTGLIPPLIVVIGIPNSVYLISKYHTEYRKCRNKIRALVQVIQKIGLVTLMINANTALGFLTLYFTDVVPLQQFGLIACIATMLTYLISIILIPGVLSLLPPPTEKSVRHLDSVRVRKAIAFFKYLVSEKRTVVYAITLIAVGVSIFGLTKLKAVSFMVDDLPKNDKIYIDLKFLESNFKGVMPFEIIVDTHKKAGLRKTQVLKKIEALQEKLSTYPELSRTTSVTDIFKLARMAFYDNKPEEYQLPSRDELGFIMSYYKKDKSAASKKNILNTIVDKDFSKTRITGNVKDIGSIKMEVLMGKIQADMDSIFKDPENESSVTTMITGTTKIFIKANDYLVKNLFWSLIATFVLIAGQMYWLFKSWKITLVSMLANFIPLLIIAGVMGFTNIPLKPSTVLIFGIAFGIAIDNTIHYLAKFRLDRKMGLNVKDATMLSLDETGQGIIYTSIILLLGFLVFVPSSFGGTVALGLLTSMTLFIALFSNLIVLPSLVISFEVQKEDVGATTLIDEYNENDDE
jgi:predicted RND superfamily exporter protein